VDPRRLRHSAWKKVKKVTNIIYFTYLPRSPCCSDRHQICSGGWFTGRNQLCQISFQSVQGLWFCRGSNFGLSHRNEVSPLTQGLDYRSAWDESEVFWFQDSFFTTLQLPQDRCPQPTISDFYRTKNIHQHCWHVKQILFSHIFVISHESSIKIRNTYTPWSIKKRATFIFMITLTNIDRFS